MIPDTELKRSTQVITFIPQSAINPNKKKVLVLDSGTLINFSMNGLLYIIPELKKITGCKFVITEQVKYEIVDRPLNVPRFELGALRIKQMIESRELELPDSLQINREELNKRTQELMNIANQTVLARGKYVKIVSDAEMSCLALSQMLSAEGIENLIAIDERTTRILSEKPENLQKLMSQRLHFNVSLKKENLAAFRKFRFIRSTELAYVGYKKGLLHVSGPKALEAALYATKFSGSSVSFEEIKVLRKL